MPSLKGRRGSRYTLTPQFAAPAPAGDNTMNRTPGTPPICAGSTAARDYGDNPAAVRQKGYSVHGGTPDEASQDGFGVWYGRI